MVEIREFFEEKKKKGRAVVDYESLLQAVPIGEENSLPFRNFRLKFNYRYSTLAAALEYLCLSGAVRRKKIKIKEYAQKVYGYWRENEGNKNKDVRYKQVYEDKEYALFAKVLLSDVQRRSLKKLRDRGDWHPEMILELQTSLDSGRAKDWIESKLPGEIEKFDKEFVHREVKKEIEKSSPKKYGLAALKEEVGKLEGRIAELEEETEYFRVSQKKNELEERATALEKQLKKMQEEEWKVREDMK